MLQTTPKTKLQQQIIYAYVYMNKLSNKLYYHYSSSLLFNLTLIYIHKKDKLIFVPVEIGESRRISKPFSKGIRVDFQFGDELVLVGCDGREHRFREDESPVLFLLQIRDGSRGVLSPLHQMYSWLVAMHRIQNNLHKQNRKHIVKIQL